jgi:putative Holliday junction resolvase
MRRMGIDYGSKRIGVALSNEDGTMAFPHAVIANDKDALQRIVALIEEKEVGEVVIGESLGRDGVPNEIQGRITDLVGDLTLHAGIPVHLEPEQYTTQQSLREQGRTAMTDASAAALILNSYIDKHH